MEEPDDLDHARVLEIAKPYLGEVVGGYGDWTPRRDRRPFSVEPDKGGPWPLRNMHVT
jgi:homospermidine synthase